jgi:hypothetical protein
LSKVVYISVFLAFLWTPVTSVAEDREKERYISSALVFDTMYFPSAFVNMWWLGSETLGVSLLEYHRAIGRYVSLSLAPEWLYVNKWRDEEDGSFTSDGWGFRTGVRAFTAGRGLAGFYLAAVFGCAWLSSSGVAFTGGFEVGYSAVWDSGVMLMSGVGFDIRFINWDTQWEEKELNTGGARLFLNIGYGW